MDEIVISRAELFALPNYSASLPTGQTIGKRWRFGTQYHVGKPDMCEWRIGEYVEHSEPNTVGITWVWAVDEDHAPHRGVRG